MKIRQKGQIGGAVVLGALVVSAGVMSVGVNHIRFGGALSAESEKMLKLTGDVVPATIIIRGPAFETTRLYYEPDSFEARRELLKEMEGKFRTKVKAWQSAGMAPHLRKQFDRTVAEAEGFFKALDTEFLPAVARRDKAAMDATFMDLMGRYDLQAGEADAMADLLGKERVALQQQADRALMVTSAVMIGLALLVIAMLVAGLWYLNRLALVPIARTADAMERMAAGDLDAVVEGGDRKDEVGTMVHAIEVFRDAAKARAGAEEKQRAVVAELAAGMKELATGNLAVRLTKPLAAEYEPLRLGFNDTVSGLAETLTGVAHSAASVSNGSSEIRAASDDLARRTEQQAASLEETTAAMNQVTSGVSETARSAMEVTRSIAEAHREASDGGVVVERTVAAMGAIEQSSNEITQIINVIDGIAFQTNLLALNAGVEAARAGEAGRGFAVVANEVRALAQRSADAAKDIKKLILASGEQVASGVDLVGQTGEVLKRIVARVGQISTMVNEIAQSAEAQAANLQQVNCAVGDMDKTTQQNAAMVEETTAAARSLASEADVLSSLISRFVIDGEHRSAPPAPVAHNVTRRGAARSTPRPATAPVVGNLAVKDVVVDDADWTEF